MSKELTTGERKTLKQLEATIKHGLASFYEVGNALSAIRDMRLYRSEFKTFEEYCQDRWGFRRDYANKLIASAKVVESLDTNVSKKPDSEGVARALGKAPEDKRQEVWQQAIERSGGKPTAAEVKAVVAEICEEEEESETDEEEPEEDDRPTDEEVSIARHALRALVTDAIEAWHSGGYLGVIDVKIGEVLRELADEFGDD